MAVTIQIRRDTLDNWETINPILAIGEIGALIEYDENNNINIGKLKIGNGESTWTDLPYISTGTEYSNDITTLNNNISEIQTDITSIDESLSTLDENVSDLNASINTITNNITALDSKVIDNNTKLSNDITNINGTINGIVEEQQSITEEFSNVVQTVESYNGKLDIIETNISSNASNIQELDNRIDSVVLQINGINATVSDIDSFVRSNINEIKNIIKDIPGDISDINTNISTLSSTVLEKADADHTHIIDDIDGLSTELSNKANKVHTHTIAEINNLQTELNSKLSVNSTIPSDKVIVNNNTLTDTLNAIPRVGTYINNSIGFDELSVANIKINDNGINVTLDNDNIKNYSFNPEDENAIATIADVENISKDVDKLRGITITPADISDEENAEWVISKDGEDVNNITVYLDHYNDSYQPTRLPSVYEVSGIVVDSIEDHNTDQTSHSDIRSAISTIESTIDTNIENAINSHNTSETAHANIIAPITATLDQLEESTNTELGRINNALTDINAEFIQTSAYVEDIHNDTDIVVDHISAVVSNIETITVDNVDDIKTLSADVSYINHQINIIDEGRWTIAKDDDGEDIKTTPFTTPSEIDATLTDVYGFYFAPYGVFGLQDVVQYGKYIKINSIDINIINDSSIENNIALVLYTYVNNNFYEIGRSKNYIKISPDENSYTFIFQNTLTNILIDDDARNIVSNVIYAQFIDYATGSLVNTPLILKTIEPDPAIEIGSIVNAIDIYNTRIEDIFPFVTITYDICNDVIDELGNIQTHIEEMLSADNLVLGWNKGDSSGEFNLPPTELSSISPKVLTVNSAPIYEADENVPTQILPYTGTTQVLLTKPIKVTGISNVGAILNGETLSAGSDITEILQHMLSVPIEITANAPTVSFILKNENGGAILTTGKYEIGTTFDLCANVTYTDGRYIIDNTADPMIVSAADTSATSYKISWNVPGGASGTAGGTISNIINPDTFKFTKVNSIFNFTAVVDHSDGITPNNNVGNEIVSSQITANSVSSNTITLTPAAYGYYGFDDGTSTINASYIKALQKIPANLNIGNGTVFNIALPAGSSCKRFIIAYPNNFRELSKVEYVEDGNTNYTGNFNQHSNNMAIEGVANSGITKGYRVYTYGSASDAPWNGPVTFKVTI